MLTGGGCGLTATAEIVQHAHIDLHGATRSGAADIDRFLTPGVRRRGEYGNESGCGKQRNGAANG